MLLAGAQGMGHQLRMGLPRRRGIAAALGVLALIAGACAFPIGYSSEGRPLTVQKFGDGDKYVLLVGGLHTGSEDNSRIIVEQLAVYLDENPDVIPDSVTVLVMPSVNPDGSANGTHTNARGVDLNRNWPTDDWVSDACHPETGCRTGLGGPAPLSEPETAALYALVDTIKPEVTIVWHAQAPLIEANEVPGAEAYGRAFANAAGYEYVEEWTAYDITGELIDGLEQQLGLRAFDVEMSECCSVSTEEFNRNLQGLVATLRAVDRGPAEPTPAATPPRPAPTIGIPPDL
jgi:predicted deacylase